MKEDGLTENDRQYGYIHRIADPVIGAGSDQKDGSINWCERPLANEGKEAITPQEKDKPCKEREQPESQREGTSRTASPEDCSSSQGMTPATVPGIKAMKKSERRTTMKILL
jgi:hypothetical protein